MTESERDFTLEADFVMESVIDTESERDLVLADVPPIESDIDTESERETTGFLAIVSMIEIESERD